MPETHKLLWREDKSTRNKPGHQKLGDWWEQQFPGRNFIADRDASPYPPQDWGEEGTNYLIPVEGKHYEVFKSYYRGDAVYEVLEMPQDLGNSSTQGVP